MKAEPTQTKNKSEVHVTLRANDLFKLSKVTTKETPQQQRNGICSSTEEPEVLNGCVSKRKLSFFAKNVPTYAITWQLQRSNLKLAREKAIQILAKESKDLRTYIFFQYNLTLDLDPISGACLFPTQKRWLKGEEYGFLIRHYFAYTQILNLFPCIEKEHPNSVYDQPERT